MKTQIVNQIRIAALSALLALGAASISGIVHADRIGAYNVPVDHQGPGIGCIKSAPFVHIASGSPQAQSRGSMSFHILDNSSPNGLWATRLGPGSWSVKSAGNH